eukprot:146136_1
MALTPPTPLTLSTDHSAHSTVTRKSYHIRRESAILRPKKVLSRNRSHTDVDDYHDELVQNTAIIHHKRQSTKTKRKPMNRRFESPIIKLHRDGIRSSPLDINQASSYHKSLKPHNHYKDPLQDILQQFRDIIVPLQTEIKSLRNVTKDLQDQVHILQNENAMFRKQREDMHSFKQSNPYVTAPYIESIHNGYYGDASPNALNIPITPDPPILPNNPSLTVQSVNPVYLFSPQSKQTRTISNATVSRLEHANVNYKYLNVRQSDTMTRAISQEMEEDTLEIGGKSYIDPVQVDMDENDEVSVNIDISSMDHVGQTPDTVSSSQSNIERTYHYAPSLSDCDRRSLPSPTPISSIHKNPRLELNHLNASLSVKRNGEQKYTLNDRIKRNAKRNSFV